MERMHDHLGEPLLLAAVLVFPAACRRLERFEPIDPDQFRELQTVIASAAAEDQCADPG